MMPADVIIDMWEMAHVKNASELLDNLGFNTKEINLSKLSSVIDEELQGVHTDKEFNTLLRVNIIHFVLFFFFSTRKKIIEK